MRKFCLLLVALLACASTFAQKEQATWTAKLEPADARVGESAQVVVEAKVESGWHVYSMAVKGGPRPTVLTLDSKALEPNGNPIEPKPILLNDPQFGITVGTFEKTVRFGIPVKVKAAGVTTVNIDWQACDETTCTRPMISSPSFSFAPSTGAPRADRLAPVTAPPAQEAQVARGEQPPTAGAVGGEQNSGDIENALKKGLLPFLLVSFLAGLGALLTPCVFPMVPITVSYFSKRAEDKQKGIAGAAAYSLGIVSTFTVLGVAVAAIFGGSKLNAFATHPITNLVLALLFIVLAFNLFGVYEIRLPNWLVNKAQTGTRTDGLAGPFMMGLVFTMTSFTCTVGFVGAILAKAAAGGGLLTPILGMLAFGIAFACPFFLLALFPQYLSSLPKAGSWMISVKATMGFIELAAAAKFLSNADLVWQLAWLTRPVFLAIWAIIFVIAGLYLLGWLRLPHDDPEFKRGIPRFVFALFFGFVGVFCLAAMAGAPTGELSAFLPPEPYPGQHSALVGKVAWESDYGMALERAKREKKQLFINFTGVTCTNCRWMEQNMFTRSDVASGLSSYIPVELWTDRPGDEANAKLQAEMTGLNTLPIYVIVSSDGKPVRRFEGSTRNPSTFVTFINGERMAASR